LRARSAASPAPRSVKTGRPPGNRADRHGEPRPLGTRVLPCALSAPAPGREAGRRHPLLIRPAMTHSFRRFLPLVLAAAVASSLSCKRTQPQVEAVPAAKPAASASLVATPAASTA